MKQNPVFVGPLSEDFRKLRGYAVSFVRDSVRIAATIVAAPLVVVVALAALALYLSPLLIFSALVLWSYRTLTGH